MNSYFMKPPKKKMSTGIFIIICLVCCSMLGAIQSMTVGNCFDMYVADNDGNNNNKGNNFGCIVFQLLNLSLCLACILKTFDVF